MVGEPPVGAFWRDSCGEAGGSPSNRQMASGATQPGPSQAAKPTDTAPGPSRATKPTATACTRPAVKVEESGRLAVKAEESECQEELQLECQATACRYGLVSAMSLHACRLLQPRGLGVLALWPA